MSQDTLRTLRELQAANPTLHVYAIEGPEFARYGKVLARYDAAEMIARARAIVPASDAVVYEPSVEALEEPCALNTAMYREVYGEMPVQVGWCYGRNLRLGALEYHKGNEVNVCVTDVVLLVGHIEDVVFSAKGASFDTAQVAAFYAPAGCVVELPSWNLHFAPIHVRERGSFATLVYLPQGTNEALAHDVAPVGENALLFAVNKWLIAHPDATDLVEQGACLGLIGDDIVVRPIPGA